MTEPSRLPDVTGTTLDGAAVALPADLPAEWTLLVVRFREELDPLADQWVRAAAKIAEGTGGRLAALELPLLSRRLRLFRAVVDAELRAKAEDDAERARTLPLYVDRAAFGNALGLRDQGEVYALLVGRSGDVAWRGEGRLTPEKIAELERAVGETLSALPPEAARPRPAASPAAPSQEGAETA